MTDSVVTSIEKSIARHTAILADAKTRLEANPDDIWARMDVDNSTAALATYRNALASWKDYLNM